MDYSENNEPHTLENEDYYSDSGDDIKDDIDDPDECDDIEHESMESENSPQKSQSLYSGIDDMISNDVITARPYQSLIKPQDVSNHLKGSLSFGLAAAKTTTKPSNVVPGPYLKMNNNSTGLKVHRPVIPRKKEMDDIDHLSEDLKLGYRILMELMSNYLKATNGPFMEAIETDPVKNKDYMEVIDNPIWLKKIKEKLLGNEYSCISEIVGDLRLMLENAYKYYGPPHIISKKGLRLEHMLEQKLALLPKETKELCCLEKTSGIPIEDLKETHRNKSARISVNGDNFFSHILHRVRNCRINRKKDLKKRRMDNMRLAKANKELEIIKWEDTLLTEPLNTQMKAMWEIVQIGHFIYLILKTLNINEIPQYELERMLLMPQCSSSLRMLMTSLLSSPANRVKISEKPYMPYKIWARKLASKTIVWYRCYYRENRDAVKVFDQIGVEPQFWQICGETNLFDKLLFHEMTFHQRVWMLKSLCDFMMHNHKTIQDVLAEQNESDLRECVLGCDRHGNQFLHFPQFCGQDLRIYRRAPFKNHDFAGRNLNEQEKKDEPILPKEKVKMFKKMMKKMRKAQEKDRDWGTPKVKKKAGKKHRHRDPQEVTAVEMRSRPGNLRQRPRASYKEVIDFEISSDDDDICIKIKSKKKKKKKKKKKSKHRNDSDDEGSKSKSSDKSASTSRSESPLVGTPSVSDNDAESLTTRAQQKNPRLKKTGRKKNVCEICLKTFNSAAAVKGHRAIHTKEKLKLLQQSRESTPLPSNETQNNESPSKETTPDQTKSEEPTSDQPKIKEPTLDQSSTCKTETNQPQSNKTTSNIQQNKDTISNQPQNTETTLNQPPNKETSTKPDSLSKEDRINPSEGNCDLTKDINIDIKEEPLDSSFETNKEPIQDIKENKSISEDIKKESQINDLNLSKKECTQEELEHTKKDYLQPSDPIKEENIENETNLIKKESLDNESNLIKNAIVEDSSNPPKNESSEATNCDDLIKEPKLESKEKIKLEDEKPLFDGMGSFVLNSDDFNLICASMDDLRVLIKRFGPLPAKGKEKNNDKKNDSDDEEEEEREEQEEEKKEISSASEEEGKLPRCEERLHKALCKLLLELLPFESNLVKATKRMRNKLRKEHTDWINKGPDYVDPAEEVWASDPEPEVEAPPPTQTEPQSSSSSSEASLDEDGNPKRKLRKRRAKKSSVTPAPTPPMLVDSEPEEESNSFTVSSRGRVRKVKKMINYDNLDFDKLATQAKEEAINEREKKKRKRDDDEEEYGEGPSSTTPGPPLGVKRYLLSQTGQVMGYIDNDGRFHSGAMKPETSSTQSASSASTGVKRYLLSKSGQVTGYIGSDGKVHSEISGENTSKMPKTEQQQQQQPPPPTASSSSNNNNNKFNDLPPDKQPTVVVAAINDKNTPVYVRVVGTQAIELLKYMKPGKHPVTKVKLQHYGQTYTVNSNAYISYCNIPGLADNISPKTPPAKVTTLPSSTPSFGSPIAASSPIKMNPPVTIPNTIALAYRGVPSISKPQIVTTVQQNNRQNNDEITGGVSLSSNTNLVSAIPSLVSSVSPYQTTSKINQNISRQIASTQSQIITQKSVAPVMSQTSTSGGAIQKQVIRPQLIQSNVSTSSNPVNKTLPVQGQLKLGTESLQKLIQNAGGNKIVAVPNGKGGYTLSMTPIVGTNDSLRQVVTVSNDKPSQNQSLVNIRIPTTKLSAIQKPNEVNVTKPIISSSIRTNIMHDMKSPNRTTQSPMPTRYVIQPQVLNQGVAGTIPSSVAIDVKTPVKQNVITVVSTPNNGNVIQNSPQKTVIVGSQVINSANQNQRIIATPINTQQLQSSPRTILINQQGQQIIRLASNTIVQSPSQQQQQQQQPPTQQLVRLHQPMSLNVGGTHKVVQVLQPGGRQVIQMLQPVNNSGQPSVNQGAVAGQIIQTINNTNIVLQPQHSQVQMQSQQAVQVQQQVQPQQQVIQSQQVIQPQHQIIQSQHQVVESQQQVIQPQHQIVQSQQQIVQPQHQVVQSQQQIIQPQHQVVQSQQQIIQPQHQVIQTQQQVIQSQHQVVQQQMEPQQTVHYQPQQIQIQQDSLQPQQLSVRLQTPQSSASQLQTQNSAPTQNNLVIVRTAQGEKMGIRTSQGIALLSQEQVQALKLQTQLKH